MYCKHCGTEIPDAANICYKCGKKVKGTAKVAKLSTTKPSPVPVDKEPIKAFTGVVTKKAEEVKDVAVSTKGDITAKITELDRMLESAITEYNDAYTLMNDKGMQLFVERCRAIDSISNVEHLVNSIANRPKSFDTDFKEIDINRKQFIDTCEFAEREIQAAREAAGGAGAGLAAGASVAFLGPSAAMWVATTFGTASTGTAISTLSGAAATKAALAWLGGGTLATGGGGIATGQAFLALAGPIGWTIAGATLLTSIVLFTKNRTKLNKEKNEEIEAVKKNIELIKEMDMQLYAVLSQTKDVRNNLNSNYQDCLALFNGDYSTFTDEDKTKLGAMVNLTKSLSALYGKQLNQEG